MLILISPAKIQNTKPQHQEQEYTLPVFLKESQQLVKQIQTYSISDLAELLKVNMKIAEQNADRFFNWNLPFTPDNAKQALWTYNGEVYHGLDVHSLSADNIIYAKKHLRILSGLYGVLSPLDLIQPYRLDVSDKLENDFGHDLYAFWKEKITNEVNKALLESGEPKVIINLMSGEYKNALDIKKINGKILDFDFLQYQPDTEKYKPIVVYIKKARGMMTRFIIQNKITDIDDLRGFSADGYWIDEQLSTKNKLVFTR